MSLTYGTSTILFVLKLLPFQDVFRHDQKVKEKI